MDGMSLVTGFVFGFVTMFLGVVAWSLCMISRAADDKMDDAMARMIESQRAE